MDRSRSLCIHEDATRGQAWCRHSHDLHIWAIDICKCCANLGSVLPKIRPALSAGRVAGQSGTHLKPGFEMGTREESCSLKHTYIHTWIHTYIHTYVHTYIHTYIHMGACAHMSEETNVTDVYVVLQHPVFFMYRIILLSW